jgi:hypothetical protein
MADQCLSGPLARINEIRAVFGKRNNRSVVALIIRAFEPLNIKQAMNFFIA